MAGVTDGAQAPKREKAAKVVAITCASLFGLVVLAIIFGDHDATNGVASNESAPTTANAAPAAQAQADETPPPPAHNWQYREGQEYGYPNALSDDDKRAGTGASTVQMYRYLGEKKGIYTVAEVTPGGLIYASCANPCEVVKVRAGGMVERFEFNPSTIVGGALTDAMNGQMAVYGSKPDSDNTEADAE